VTRVLLDPQIAEASLFVAHRDRFLRAVPDPNLFPRRLGRGIGTRARDDMTAVALLRAAGNGLAKRAANASAGVAAAAQQVRAVDAIPRRRDISRHWAPATAVGRRRRPPVPSRRAND
jgi:hypothetical protein